MTTTPRLGITELALGQAVPEATVNAAVLTVELFATRMIVKGRQTAPPGSPASGDSYLIDGTGSGAWAGHDNVLAYYSNGAWYYMAPKDGFEIEVEDEDTCFTYRGSTWVASGVTAEDIRDTIGTALQGTSGGGVSVTVDDGADTIKVALSIPVTTQTGTSYTAVLADGNSRVRFTNAGAITFTIPPNSSVAFPTGTFIEFEQAAGGVVTATAGGGVTIVNRTGFDATAGQYAVAGLRKVATDTWSLTGDLA